MNGSNFFFNKELNFSQIERLYESAYKRRLDYAYWKWRFKNNPVSEKIYISYMFDDGNLAAYYAVSPVHIKIENRIIKAALSNMTMTGPGHSGKGYFQSLARQLYAHLRSDGYEAVIGFANHNSHYAFRKYLGWRDLSLLNIFSCEKQSFSFYLNIDKSITFEDGLLREEDLASCETMNITDNNIFLQRDTNYLKWRLLDNPINRYHCLKIYYNSDLQGIIFYKLFNEDIDIMEIFYSSISDDVKNILLHSIYFLFRNKTEKINIWSNIYSDEHLILEKAGFKESEFNTYFGIIPLADYKDNHDIFNIKKWHYRFIDSDNF